MPESKTEMTDPQIWEPALNAISSASASIVIAGGGIFLALINKKINSIKRAAESSAVQLNNDHVENPDLTGNLREDLDQKHEKIAAAQTEVIAALGEIRRDIHGLREDHRITDRAVSTVQDSVLELSKRISSVEKSNRGRTPRETPPEV